MSRMAERPKPMIGEIKSDRPMLVACDQSTPLVAEPAGARNWWAGPTPMIEPTSVCELDDGRPRYQVPRFQTIAAINRAKTMARPEPEPTCRMSSTGNKARMPKATAPVDVKTPRKLKKPDQMTANSAGMERV